jgi:chromosome segregation ATPase
MEELRAKLAALKETHDAILKEKKVYDDKAYELSNTSDKLQTEMWDIEQQIQHLSPALSPSDKEDLKRDFDYIMSIIEGLEDKSGARQDRNLYMYLKHAEEDYRYPDKKWSTSLDGSLEDIKITIYTKLEHVKHAVRRAFTQNECTCTNVKYTERETMERTRWFHGSNGGCLSLIIYDAKVLEE